MELNLANKKILFIAPIFYNYHILIKRQLEQYGAEVYFKAERNYSMSFTIVNNFAHSRLDEYQSKHYKNILKELDEIEFDYLFVIKGYKMPGEFLDLFKKRYPAAVMIMHQWDSERNNPFSHLLLKFDKVFSFDPVDLKKYPQMEYLPNFYLDDIYDADSYKIQYDILFLASYLPERLEILTTLRDFAAQNGLKLKAMLVMPFTTYFKELIKGNRIDLNFIKFSPLSRMKYLKLFWESKIIFDMGSKTQTGMSQRTIETIECGKKLLTNNTYIKNEEIFNEDQVFIVSDQLSSEIIRFAEKPFTYRNTGYSLESWISRIFR